MKRANEDNSSQRKRFWGQCLLYSIRSPVCRHQLGYLTAGKIRTDSRNNNFSKRSRASPSSYDWHNTFIGALLVVCPKVTSITLSSALAPGPLAKQLTRSSLPCPSDDQSIGEFHVSSCNGSRVCVRDCMFVYSCRSFLDSLVHFSPVLRQSSSSPFHPPFRTLIRQTNTHIHTKILKYRRIADQHTYSYKNS